MIKYLIIIITTNCNLNCIYCYIGDQKKLVITKYIIDKGLSLIPNKTAPLHIQITGGEPTLYPELIEYTCKNIKKHLPMATIGIQTNATLLDSSIVKIFKKFNLQVGVSLDGPGEVHNILRGKFTDTIKGIELLKRNRIKCRITTTLTSFNVSSLKKLALLIDLLENIEGIGLDMVVKKGRAKDKDYLFPDKLEIYSGIMDFMRIINLIKATKDFHFREQDMLSAYRKNKKHVFCHAQQGESIAIFPDGNLYPCAQTAGDKRFLLGHISNYKIEKYEFNNFTNKDKSCSSCNISSFCPGDCPSRNFYNGSKNKKLVCSLYFAILKAQGVHYETS